jgi:sporulation protein YlmC with PRC-barrel domain
MSRYPGFSPLSDLVGMPVVDSQGTVVGQLSEFLIDEVDGRIAYIQFELTRDHSDVGRRITVPWSSIQSTRKSRSGWRLSVGKSTLDALSRPRRF